MFKKLLPLGLCLALLLGTAGPSAALPLEKVACSEAVRGFFFLPLYLAHGLKLFEKQGLEVEIVSTQGGPLAMQALVAGQVQFCATGHGQVANMYDKGQSTKIVNQMQDKCTFYLVGRLEIKSIQELKGQTIGCTKVGAETDAVGRFLAASVGLDPQKDISMQGVGGMDTMASALDNNRVQAVMAWQPLTAKLLAENKGVLLARLNTKADSQKHFGAPAYSFSVLQVTDEYIKKHPATVQKFVNALLEAERWILAHSDQEVAAVVQPYFAGLPLELITNSVQQDRQASSPDGLVSQEGHDMAVKVFREAGIIKNPVPFVAIVDNSFSQKAQAAR
jgi:NitT/TauT family transport system substrate-binding protein